ncbi:hypothetical protein [Variovorax paradoxus]|uniref:hypothetical protein n=1 Tax=Variovorax paradoxus TaxID=34073 RepID=UPI003ECE5ED9
MTFVAGDEPDCSPGSPGALLPIAAQRITLHEMYVSHPSLALHALFRAKPYQGAAPEKAHFVFVGLDANYAPEVERSASFALIKEYHIDGVSFWQRHGVHHPFLHPGYVGDRRGGGVPYHRNFASIGFTSQDAPCVSFVELLHVPTVGTSALDPNDLDEVHLDRLAALMCDGQPRNVFLCADAVRQLRRNPKFSWLPRVIAGEVLPVLCRTGKTTIYQNLHFSCREQQRRRAEAVVIAALARAQPCVEVRPLG